MRTEEPQAVKYFVGALFSDKKILTRAKLFCSEKIGETENHSEAFPFEATHYYDAEMGLPIFRIFFSFKALMSPGKLAELKVLCNEIEEQLLFEGTRKVNLDIGYLDFHKVVLASAKYNGQKIYLGQGIYADLTLTFSDGQFHPLENTFPDFKSGKYNEVLLGFRNTFKSQCKA